MILSVHALAGAVAASYTDNWPAAIAFSLLSHFILDTIPHWHYPVFSEKSSIPTDLKYVFHLWRSPKELFRHPVITDLISSGLDLALGLALLWRFSAGLPPEKILLFFGGGILGVLPDFITLLYILFPNNRPLAVFRAIHKKTHSNIRLDENHFWGISSQAGIALILILLLT